MDQDIKHICKLTVDNFNELKTKYPDIRLYGTRLFLSPPKPCTTLIFGRDPGGIKEERVGVECTGDLFENEMLFVDSAINCIVNKASSFDKGVLRLFCLALHGEDKTCWYKHNDAKDCHGIDYIKRETVVANLIPFQTGNNWKQLRKIDTNYWIPIANALIKYIKPSVIVLLGKTIPWHENKLNLADDINVKYFYHPSARVSMGSRIKEAKELRDTLSSL